MTDAPTTPDPGAPQPKPRSPKTRKRKPKPQLPKFTLPRAAGRPVLYDGPAHCARAKRLGLLGLTDAEIAQQFGIDDANLYRWQNTYPEFREALLAGKLEADADVAASMYKRALGYEKPAVKIFMPAGSTTPVYADYMEHYPGDVGAQKSWLYNRQPERWRDRREVKVGGTIDLVARMTPEERERDAMELMNRLRRRLVEAQRTIEASPVIGEDVSEAEGEG